MFKILDQTINLDYFYLFEQKVNVFFLSLIEIDHFDFENDQYLSFYKIIISTMSLIEVLFDILI